MAPDRQGPNLGLCRILHGADIHGVAAAGPKMTTARWVHRGRDVTLEHDALSPQGGVEAGRGGEQRLGVGMVGRVVEILDRTFLDDAPEIHHRDPVTERTHQIEVVGDEEIADAEPSLEVAEQVDHLHLRGDVQRAERLVEHQELGFGGQGSGDGRTLQLAPRDLAGTPAGEGRRKPDLLEQLGDPQLASLAAQVGMDGQRLADTRPDVGEGVEGGIRVLKDELHATAQRPQTGAFGRGDVVAAEQHPPTRRTNEAEHQPGQGRLARTALARRGRVSLPRVIERSTWSTACTVPLPPPGRRTLKSQDTSTSSATGPSARRRRRGNDGHGRAHDDLVGRCAELDPDRGRAHARQRELLGPSAPALSIPADH